MQDPGWAGASPASSVTAQVPWVSSWFVRSRWGHEGLEWTCSSLTLQCSIVLIGGLSE